MVKTSWNEFRLRKIPEGISMGQLSIKYPGSFQIEVTLAHNLDHFVIRELLHHHHGNQLVPCVIGCLISNLFSLLCPLGPQVGLPSLPGKTQQGATLGTHHACPHLCGRAPHHCPTMPAVAPPGWGICGWVYRGQATALSQHGG